MIFFDVRRTFFDPGAAFLGYVLLTRLMQVGLLIAVADTNPRRLQRFSARRSRTIETVL